MSWWGKVVGGVFGAMLLGPIGAVLGTVLGHSFDRGLERVGHDAEGVGWSPRERVQTAFFTATFAVMGHVAKADGRVSEDEIGIASELMDHMQLNADQRELAQGLFRQGRDPGFDLDGVLGQLRNECQGRPDLVQVFLEIQLSAAYVDGTLHDAERAVLERIRRCLRVRPQDFARIETLIAAQFRDSRGGRAPQELPLEEAHAVLGLAGDASDEQVKRAYRRLMSRHHPDKLVAQGLPEEMVEVATEKSKEISLAYERIRSARGL